MKGCLCVAPGRQAPLVAVLLLVLWVTGCQPSNKVYTVKHMRSDVENYIGRTLVEVPTPGGALKAKRQRTDSMLRKIESLTDGGMSFQSQGLSASVETANRGMIVSVKDSVFTYVTWRIYTQIISSDLIKEEPSIAFLVRAIEADAPSGRTIPTPLWDEPRWQSLKADMHLLLQEAVGG